MIEQSSELNSASILGEEEEMSVFRASPFLEKAKLTGEVPKNEGKVLWPKVQNPSLPGQCAGNKGL